MHLRDVPRIYIARSLRGFGDGCAAILIPLYLTASGFSPDAIGAISSAMMLGSAATLLTFALFGHRLKLRTTLMLACVGVAITGVNFALFSGFLALLLVAAIGTINPTGGDNNIFRPLEQTALSEAVPESRRTSAFAIYAFLGFLAGGCGAAAAALPEVLSGYLDRATSFQAVMAAYSAFGVIGLLLYRDLSVGVRRSDSTVSLHRPSRRVVWMTALFSVDALGGGFTLNAVLTLWLLQRFEISAVDAGSLFFATGLCSAVSLLAAPLITRRVGLVGTMVGSQLAACALVLATLLAPTLFSASVCLILRSFLNQIDGPARASFVISAVPEDHRAAAASLTTMPFVLAAAVGPVVVGVMLSNDFVNLPLLIGVALKVVFNALFLIFVMNGGGGGIDDVGDSEGNVRHPARLAPSEGH